MGWRAGRSGHARLWVKLAMALAAGAVLAIAAVALAATPRREDREACLLSSTAHASACPGRVFSSFGGGTVPRSLPSHRWAPIALKLWGRIANEDGTHPPALRELGILIDRGIALDGRGLPSCHPNLHYQGTAGLKQICKEAFLGDGEAHFEYAYPEEAPTRVAANIGLYNGGRANGVARIFALLFIHGRLPATVVVPIEVKKVRDGRAGLQAVAKIPPTAGGYGSLLDFSLKIKRLFTYNGARKSYASARCPDGRLELAITALFRNDAQLQGVPPATTTRGLLASPCRPTG